MTRFTFISYALLLGALTMMEPIAIDTFTPAIESVADGLNSNRAAVQFSLAALFLGSAIGQLIYGPLSDRFGRKPVVLCALSVFLLSIGGAILAPDIDTFTLWRFLQGLAMASGRILAGAVARDFLEKDRLSQMISASAFVGATAGLLAPIMGGFLVEHFAWQSVFYLMAGLTTLIIISVLLFFEESLPPVKRQPFHVRAIADNFLEISRNRLAVSYILCGGFALSGIGVFLSISESVLVGRLGLTSSQYGLAYSAVLIGLSIGTGVTTLLVSRLGSALMLRIGLIIMVIGGVTLLCLTLLTIETVIATMAPMFVFAVGFSIVTPLAVAGTLTQFSEIAGTASSFNGFIGNMMVAIMVAASVSLIDIVGVGAQLSLGLAVAGSAIASGAIYRFLIFPKESPR